MEIFSTKSDDVNFGKLMPIIKNRGSSERGRGSSGSGNSGSRSSSRSGKSKA